MFRKFLTALGLAPRQTCKGLPLVAKLGNGDLVYSNLPVRKTTPEGVTFENGSYVTSDGKWDIRNGSVAILTSDGTIVHMTGKG